MWPRRRWWPVCGCRPARAAAARRSAPTRPSPRGWRRWRAGWPPKGHPGGDGGHRPVLEAGVAGAGGAELPAAACERPPGQDPARPQDRRGRCRLAGGVAGAWAAAGQLRAPAPIRELRDLTRYRKRLIQAHTAEVQRIQKTLEDAGIKLDSVAADVLGVSGRAMLAALVGGERDPQVLAELAKGRLRVKLPQLRQALRGRFGDHHGLLVGLALDHLEHLEVAIATLDGRIDEVIGPFAVARDRLDTITGVGKRAAECIIAEIGVDMSVFPTAGQIGRA